MGKRATVINIERGKEKYIERQKDGDRERERETYRERLGGMRKRFKVNCLALAINVIRGLRSTKV